VLAGRRIAGRPVQEALQREQPRFIFQVGDALEEFELEGFEVQFSKAMHPYIESRNGNTMKCAMIP
jgi:hypothetical protein